MVWLTWRQHRAEGLGGLLALAAVAAILLALGLPARHAFDHEGLAACLGQVNPAPVSFGDKCGEALKQFSGRYLNSGVGALIPWLNFLPACIGVFVGATLLAREFDFEGLAIPAYALFALALGTLAGVLARRTVIAMAATLGGFLAVRLPVEFWLRPHYQHPVTMAVDPLSSHGPTRTDLLLSSNLLDPAGHSLGDVQSRRVMDTALQSASHGDVRAWLHAHGYRWSYVFQPASRFWHFQLTEAALFAGLAVILLTAVAWQLRRRVG